MQVFGEPLGLASTDLAAVAGQLLCRVAGSPRKGVRSRGQRDADRPLAAVILALLNVVRCSYVIIT